MRLPRRFPDEREDPPDLDEKTGELIIEVQVFADLEDSGRRYRVGGTVQRGPLVPLSEDPTTALVHIADEARQTHLGDLLGDLRTAGCDVTRFEFYAAPFRIELADDLRDRLADSWRDRPPG